VVEKTDLSSTHSPRLTFNALINAHSKGRLYTVSQERMRTF